MELALSRESKVPLYRQIVEQVRGLIRTGALPPGGRLPAVRQLAAHHGLTRLTVHSAYEELQAEGLIESYVGRGTFVARGERSSLAPAPTAQPPSMDTGRSVLGRLLAAESRPNTISFATAMPDPGTYPVAEIAAALQGAVGDGSALNYGPIQGDPGLREQLSALLLDRRLSVSPEDILVTSGAQQGIDLVLRALLGPSDVMLVEEPAYPGVLEAAAQQRRRVVGVPRDERGLDMNALEEACRIYRPSLLYVIPTFGNPTGASLPEEQGSALLALARAHRFHILEDDLYGFLALDGPAPPPLKSRDTEGRVIYVTSLSKSLSPALRLGAVVAPPAELSLVAEARHSVDLVSSLLLQRAGAEYLRTGHLRTHLERVRPLYRERRNAMLRALEEHLPDCTWTYPAGGLSVWVTLPDGIDERDFVRDAMEEGVAVAPGRAFVPRSRHHAAMRLGFGMQPPERIRQGVATLGHVLQRHTGRRGTLAVAGHAGPLV